jgi:hypothetical protein
MRNCSDKLPLITPARIFMVIKIQGHERNGGHSEKKEIIQINN